MLQYPSDQSGEHDRTPAPGPGTSVHVTTPGECASGPVARIQSSSHVVTVSVVTAASVGMAGHPPL